jgi:hypothetical protein
MEIALSRLIVREQVEEFFVTLFGITSETLSDRSTEDLSACRIG